MRIALDARTIYRRARRGTGKNLIDLYRHVAAANPTWRVLAYHRESDPDADALAALNQSNIEPRRVEMVGDRIDAWGRLRLPVAAWRDGADLLHCPANDCPAWLPIPTVVTIHDLIPLDLPGEVPRDVVRRFEKSVRTACRRADWIICPSVYTRDRLVRDLDADAGRITVIPWAADSAMIRVPEDRWAPVLDHYGVDRPFVLHFGAASAAGRGRKNTGRLLEAWALLDSAIRKRWRLVIVGLSDAGRSALNDVVSNLNIGSSVSLHGFAPEAHLPTLLSAASVLAYPSLSEGFGLPVLDAWATDTAVLASCTTSIPEVVGDAGMLVDPTDPCAMARGLVRVIGDSALRDELVRRGRERLWRYHWPHTAELFTRTIQGVLAQRQPRRAAA